MSNPTKPSPQPSQEPLFRLDRYEILEPIGKGGFGIVFKARQTTTGQICALKMLTVEGEEEAISKEQIARFEREMNLTARLNNPHIVQLYDSGVAEGCPYMVLEFVKGRELRDMLDEDGALDPVDVKRLMLQILEALAEAHEKGVVHRDLKPGNIMVNGTGDRLFAKVLDFGIAGVLREQRETTDKDITVAGQIRGTPSYMSPEQLQFFAETRPQSDIYSLGLILLETLTGKKAVDADSLAEICLLQVREPTPIPPEIRQGPFGEVIARACQKEIEDRFESAEEMLTALHAVDPLGKSSPEKLVFDKPVPSDLAGRRRSPIPLILAAAILLIGGVGIGFWQQEEPTPPLEAPAPAPIPAVIVEAPAPPPPPLLGSLSRLQLNQSSALGAAGIVEDEISLVSQNLIADALRNARRAQKAKEYDKAKKYYEQVLAANPNHTEALEALGWCYVALKQFSSATAIFSRLADMKDVREETYLGLGLALEGSGKFAAAEDTYKTFLKLFPSSPQAKQIKRQQQKLHKEIKKQKKRAKELKKKSSRRGSKVKRPGEFN